MAHLTCIKHTQAEINAILDEANNRGIRNILALRGDPPPGEDWSQTEGGFEFASELVTHIRGRGDFGLAVAGFPEGHIDCGEGREVDWQHLVRKVGCGADMVITQMFFDNADYFQLADFLRGACVEAPLPRDHPGGQRRADQKFSALCEGPSYPRHSPRGWTNWATTRKRFASTASNTPRRSAANCSIAGRPACIFTPSIRATTVLQILGNLGLA